ncbi:hypothetical protein [Streptomyces xanthochromogenes]
MARSDKKLAQQALAAAIVSRGNQHLTKTLIERDMTRDEAERAQAYLQSGQKLTGR